MRAIRVAALGALVLIFALQRFYAAANQLTPVTASFRCSGGTPAFTPNPPNPCGNGDRLAGDAGGAYVGQPTGKTPPNGAYIDQNGQLWFAQQLGSGRSVFFDFSAAIPPLPQPLLRTFTTAWSTEFSPNWLASPVGVTGGLWGMHLNQQTNGTLKADFENAYDSYRWTVRFNPSYGPDATYLTITCTSGSGMTCTAWTLEATAAQAAELIASTTSGKYVTYDEGAYVMPFEMTVTYP